MNVLKRSNTTINIATYWENFQLGKYNFDPPYQRPSEVWSESKKSYLIDTILKNFPMPPIFLHQLIDESTGKTMYDVIDGKQRLKAIIDFIGNEIATPEDFGSDGFGNESLNGIFFKDLDTAEINEFKKVFWRYELTVEFIDTNQVAVVNNIFDRLNRNGEPLTRQELRNAKYHSTPLYNLVRELSKLEPFSPFYERIQQNRLEHHEFTSELLFVLVEGKVLNGDKPDILDELYSKYVSDQSFNDSIQKIKTEFIEITDIFNSFHLDYEKFKIQSTSHLYSLWGLAWALYINNVDQAQYSDINSMLVEFYEQLRQDNESEFVKEYHSAMSAGTKASSRRKKRIKSLIKFSGLDLAID